jgi:AhpD family alkylhydroperoxidase
MDTQTKELIAIGASVTANCVPCLRYHLHQARQAGADDDQIETAVKIWRRVRKGAAENWDEEADAILCLESSIDEAQESGGCGAT